MQLQPRTCVLALSGLIAGGWLNVAAAAVDLSGLSQRIGPYGGLTSIEDVQSALDAGLTLTVLSVQDPTILKYMRDQGMTYIDVRLWSLVYNKCRSQFDKQKAVHQDIHCSLSADDEASILSDAARWLETKKSDPGIVGYWILDDYPGANIAPLLAKLHALVVHAYSGSGHLVPTICGVSGTLDHRTPTDPVIRPDHQYLSDSLVNVTPQACDVLAPYFYARTKVDDAAWVDWSLSDLLPWFQQQLRHRGFDHPVLLPLLHAFGNGGGGPFLFTHPRAEDVEAQAKAYCSAGAIGLLFFTWRSRDSRFNYSNDAQISDGIARARSVCLTP